MRSSVSARFLTAATTVVLALAFAALPVDAVAVPPTPAGVAPDAQSSGCAPGPRHDAGGIEVFHGVADAGPGIALTFDMNGDPTRSVQIMNVLVAHQVCATIFLNGDASTTAHGRQVMEIIAANRHLFEVGNHTMHHCDLESGEGDAPCPGTPPSADFIRQELLDAAAVIRDGTGLDPAPYWRPPGGDYNSFVLDAAASVGYTKTFMWDVDPRDWEHPSDGGPTTQELVNVVLANARPGSIVLFHLSGWNTADALEILIPELRSRGFLPTTLSHLLAGTEVPFSDIGDSPFYDDIVWAYENGITEGCAADRYCPRQPVLRDQMASFLVRALGLTEGGEIRYFTDTAGNQHEANINRLAHAGITIGCGGGRYCPDQPVLRDQMASFLSRAYGLSAGASIEYFTDTDGNQHEPDINRLAHVGVTNGCGGGRYCPRDPVLREQMAAFLHRAAGL